MPTHNERISDCLMRTHGVDLYRYDPSFLGKSLQKRMVESQCGSLDQYAALLEYNTEERTRFFDSLHISYSGFFRNPLTFAVLECIVLPQLIVQRKNSRRTEIRIWSAACAAGQEAYSLTMLLEEMRKKSPHSFDYRVFATDHREEQIEEAKRGQYSAASLQNLSMKRVGEWFTRQDDGYVIKPQLKEKTDFSVFDLFSTQCSCPPVSIFGDFDVVICANVLFYYNEEHRKIILEKMTHCLAEGGFFMTGAAETDRILQAQYQEIFPQSAIFRLNDCVRCT